MRRRNARRQALRALYEADLLDRNPKEVLSDAAATGGLEPFAVFLVEGISKRRERIDEILAEFSIGWAPEDMPAVDRNIQRMGVFEIVFTDSPPAVVIDEAVELAMEFSTAEAARFVNGVLATVAADRDRLAGGDGITSAEGAVLDLEGVPSHLAPMTSDMCPPAYGRRSLAEAGRWILAAIGLQDWDDDAYELPAPPPLHRLVVLIVDGLGALQLKEHRDVLGTIWELPGTFATSTFPSTSATGLTSICTGAVPATHGVVGYRVLQRGRSFNVIRFAYDEDWAEEKLVASGAVSARRTPPVPSPKKYQATKTIFEAASRAKIGAYVVTKDEFEGTGFSALLLRGARWLPYERSGLEAPARVRSILEDPHRKLVYVYWDGLDREGHRHGPGSQEWRTAAAEADSICGLLLDLLRPGDGLLVTSDHGMVITPESSRIRPSEEVEESTRAIVGEPRVRYLHARPGAERRLYDAVLEGCGDTAWVFSREQAISLGLYGDVPSEEIEGRIGDVIVAMRHDAVMVDPEWPKPPPRGNHGSLTEGEMFVPFRVGVVA